MGLLDLFGRGRRDAEAVERLLEVDLDRAAEQFEIVRSRLDEGDSSRLAALLRFRLAAREHVDYLSRALAEGTVAATAACELLEAYEDAGYVTTEQFDMLRRHAFAAHRREVLQLLATPDSTRSDYFRALDAYRAAGYLSSQELAELEELLDTKLNPELAARRLFASARTTADPALQEERLRRYLSEFEGFPHYPDAASLYLSIKIHEAWDELPGIRYAREATAVVLELNNLLEAYLPYTADLSSTVPIERITHEFFGMASEFEPLPDVEEPITELHLNRRVVVVHKADGEPGSYRSERNGLVPVGAKGRVKGVRGDLVVVSHSRRGLPYTQGWTFEEFTGSSFGKIQRGSSLAVWSQSEVGLLENHQPSPVFVHQFKEAVKDMKELLERHREDRPPVPGGPRLLEGQGGE